MKILCKEFCCSWLLNQSGETPGWTSTRSPKGDLRCLLVWTCFTWPTRCWHTWKIQCQHVKFVFPLLLGKSEDMITLRPNSHIAAFNWSWIPPPPCVQEHEFLTRSFLCNLKFENQEHSILFNRYITSIMGCQSKKWPYCIKNHVLIGGYWSCF